MKNIIVIGVSHQATGIDVREKFHLTSLEREYLLSELKNDPAVTEALVLSTCNRMEIYAHVLDGDSGILLKHLCRVKGGGQVNNYAGHFYRYTAAEAVRHLFRVASGLDSLILGEQQILSQLKEAVDRSRHQRMLSKKFNVVTNLAVCLGKKARQETSIDIGGSSVSWAAVTLASRMACPVAQKSVLILGAGKMGKLAAGYLRTKGFGQIYIMNRDRQKALALAEECQAQAVSYWELKEVLSRVDVCLCSAGAPHYLIEPDLVAQVMSERAERRLICIDISMPRNIHPAVGLISQVSLKTVDDLSRVLEDNMQRRQSAVAVVENMIDQKLKELASRLNKLKLGEVKGAAVLASAE